MASRSPSPILSERSRKKKKLFKGTKPFIRRFEIEDMWILWAAYKEGSFPIIKEGMEREEFYAFIRPKLAGYHFLFLVEDQNKRFKEGKGAICIIGANTDGWKYEPHVEYFKWATKYNKVRTTLSFLNWISFNKEVGVCIIRSLENTTKLFRYMREFIGINYVGMIPSGDIRGDEYIFSLLGKKANGSGQASKRLHRNGDGTRPASESGSRSDSSPREEVSGIGQGTSEG